MVFLFPDWSESLFIFYLQSQTTTTKQLKPVENDSEQSEGWSLVAFLSHLHTLFQASVPQCPAFYALLSLLVEYP